jgi:hypothetical protein
MAQNGYRSTMGAVRGHGGDCRLAATLTSRHCHIGAQEHAQHQQRDGKTGKQTAHGCMECARRQVVPHRTGRCNDFYSFLRNLHKR